MDLCISIYQEWLSPDQRPITWQVLRRQEVGKSIKSGQITELRNALGDDARNPSVIETIHRRGYRLIASIEPAVSDKPGISKVARFPVPERATKDDRNPYPGLAAFTEEDAEFFFGREAEVSQMWRKLTTRRLLAVIGPSGIGKSSYLRAGLLLAAPEDLRRALVQPAARLVYSFEDDGLADEMLEAVKNERSALPMLAFAVARLWEKRDTEKKELTRSAYKGIGGVSGALAQHAESTLTAIGHDRLPIVRELFRNLITAEGTRATREVENLLSVFPKPQRVEAEQVQQRLIDARLLTSFEEEVVEGTAGHHRVEVVHESLLTSWPRLVRWQTQDVGAAQLRDQLRQAARTWEEHDRTRDYLWTGTAYREFFVWHENYPGGLTELEEGFARAMTVHAKRRKRRRRIAVAAAFVGLLAVLAVVGSFWQRSVREARRAEGSELVAVGRLLESGDTFGQTQDDHGDS